MKKIISQILGCATVLIVGALVLSLQVRAQQQVLTGPPAAKKEFSQKVSEGMGKLKEYSDAKNDAKMMEQFDLLFSIAEPGDSLDRALLNLYKGNYLLSQPDSSPAIPHLELALEITSRVDFTPAISRQELLQARKNISILYYLMLNRPGLTDAQKVEAINKSVAHLEEYMRAVGTPSADDAAQYANFMFIKATTGQKGDEVDLASIRKAREAAEAGMLQDPRFRIDIYNIILTALQYEGKMAEAVEYIELLLARAPPGADTARQWQRLPELYLMLANEMADKNNEDRAHDYRLRSLVSYQRAMDKAGLFKGEKEGEDITNHVLNIAMTYANIGQFDKGSDVLVEALRANKVRPNMTERFWSAAAAFLQEIGKREKEIAVLREAATKFPNNGQFDFQLAQTFAYQENYAEAVKSIREAIRKGVAGKEELLHVSHAYYLYSMEDYDEALKAANAGLELPVARNNQNLRQIKEACEQNIRIREEKRKRIN